MPLFLIINHTYEYIEIALYEGDFLIQEKQEHKHTASKYLISRIDTILSQHKVSLDMLDFIGVNRGPGPFTTLRTAIVTANGISFSSHIPLIGINGLDAFLQEYHDANCPHTVVLLNAFGNDVYFSMHHEQGCQNISIFLSALKNSYAHSTIRFLGNGAELYKNEILSLFEDNAYIPSPLPLYCSSRQIAIMALSEWKSQKNITHHISPLYIKEQHYIY